MLVATPGQATTYSLLGNGAPKKTCLASTTIPKTTTSTSLVTTSNCNINKSSNSAASTLMKTISVRLNRGTEFLKDTVQKALINNTTSTKNISTTASNISFRSSNTNNFSTAPIASLKHNKTTAAVALAGSSSNILGNKANHSAAVGATVPYSTNTSARTSLAATSSSKSLKVNTVPPTNIHRFPQERNETTSVDSIDKELCHFKPIISAPTIRWKCGSKSRGVSAIKMPIACLATNVKNLNCDDCSIISAYSSEDDQQLDAEDEKLPEVAKHLQRYRIKRPKPSSTLLTTILTSPTHQSAFVRWVAQMKTLVNIQHTTEELTHSRFTKKIDHYKMRHAARRGRSPKTAVPLKISQMRKSPLNLPLTQIFLRSRKETFVQKKSLHTPTEITITKTKGNSHPDIKASSKPVKSLNDKKISPTLPLKAPTNSEKSNAAARSKIVNIVAIAQKVSTENTDKNGMENSVIDSSAEPKNKQRKRKIIEISNSTNKVHSSKMIEKIDRTEPDVMPPLRKSARLSKDGTTDLLIGSVKRITVKKSKLRSMNKRLSDSFSPPMTRSRLKELTQQHPTMSEGSNSIQ